MSIENILENMDSTNHRNLLELATYLMENNVLVATNKSQQIIFERLNETEMVCFLFTNKKCFKKEMPNNYSYRELNFSDLANLLFQPSSSHNKRMAVFNTYKTKKSYVYALDYPNLMILSKMKEWEKAGIEVNKLIYEYNTNSLKETKSKVKKKLAKNLLLQSFLTMPSTDEKFLKNVDGKTYIQVFTCLKNMLEDEYYNDKVYEKISYGELLRIQEDKNFDGIIINDEIQKDGLLLTAEDIKETDEMIRGEIGNYQLFQDLKAFKKEGIFEITQEDAYDSKVIQLSSLLMDSDFFVLTNKNVVQSFMDNDGKVFIPIFSDMQEVLEGINLNEIKEEPGITRIKLSEFLLRLHINKYKGEILINPSYNNLRLKNEVVNILIQGSIMEQL